MKNFTGHTFEHMPYGTFEHMPPVQSYNVVAIVKGEESDTKIMRDPRKPKDMYIQMNESKNHQKSAAKKTHSIYRF